GSPGRRCQRPAPRAAGRSRRTLPPRRRRPRPRPVRPGGQRTRTWVSPGRQVGKACAPPTFHHSCETTITWVLLGGGQPSPNIYLGRPIGHAPWLPDGLRVACA